MKKYTVLAVLYILLMPKFVHASIVFTEIMYNPAGSDSGREWVEIWNDGDIPVDISGWKFGDASSLNHSIFLPTDDKHPGQGSSTLPANGYAILADDASAFLIEYPTFSGTVLDTTLSLPNTTGIEISIRSESNGPALVSVTYTPVDGANDSGNTLSRTSAGVWTSAIASPGGPIVNTSSNSSVVPVSSPSGLEAKDAPSVPPQAIKKQTIQAITAEVSIPQNAVINIPVSMKATVFGTSGEYRSGGVFHYAFGDGSENTQEESKEITHIYDIPGVYIVTFSYKTNRYLSKPDVVVHKTIYVSDKTVVISKRLMDGTVVVSNTGPDDFDLSLWKLATDTHTFIFPDGTIIRAGGSITLMPKFTGFFDASTVSLFFPNGVNADMYQQHIDTIPKEVLVMKPVVRLASSQSIAPPNNGATENIDTTPSSKVLSANVIDSVKNTNKSVRPGILSFIVGLIGVLGIALYILKKYIPSLFTKDYVDTEIVSDTQKIADSIRIIDDESE